jgi:phospho-N-acetylmuramoyl-pentapeptide-transferase
MIDVLYLWLKDWYALDTTPARLLHFATSRMVFAFITAFAVVWFTAPRIIVMLYKRGMRDTVREYDSTACASKRGTPTMGGLIIVGGVLLSSLLWCNPQARVMADGRVFPSPMPLLLMTLLFFAGLGAIDDMLKARGGHADCGMSRRTKLGLQLLYGLFFAMLILSDGTSPFPAEVRTQLYLPGVPPTACAPPDLGWFYYAIVIGAFLGIGNAINLTDGLDGLAIVPSAFVVLVLGIFAYMFSHEALAATARFAHIPTMTEAAVFAAAFLGAAVGFLWFNSYPAQVFMGDTGSMALGGTMAALALITKAELLFLLLGGIFVYEFLSVLIQDYLGIKRLGRRLMLRAPAHHQFQALGIAETKVVVRFWIVSFLFALISLATLKLR